LILGLSCEAADTSSPRTMCETETCEAAAITVRLGARRLSARWPHLQAAAKTFCSRKTLTDGAWAKTTNARRVERRGGDWQGGAHFGASLPLRPRRPGTDVRACVHNGGWEWNGGQWVMWRWCGAGGRKRRRCRVRGWRVGWRVRGWRDRWRVGWVVRGEVVGWVGGADGHGCCARMWWCACVVVRVCGGDVRGVGASA